MKPPRYVRPELPTPGELARTTGNLRESLDKLEDRMSKSRPLRASTLDEQAEYARCELMTLIENMDRDDKAGRPVDREHLVNILLACLEFFRALGARTSETRLSVMDAMRERVDSLIAKIEGPR